MTYIQLTPENLEVEHICCGFSDKKCATGYGLKKQWLKSEMLKGYTFKRLDARAKVFIEYGLAETAWLPVIAPNYLMVNCFWVSGQYKGQGHAKALLKLAVEDAKAQGKHGLVTVVGKKKFHFMSDTKFLTLQGFQTVDQTATGFALMALKFSEDATNPEFSPAVKAPTVDPSLSKGVVAYYSHRCPFTDYYVNTVLPQSAEAFGLPCTVIHLATMEAAQSAPTPATIFSLFYDGEFVTTDLSVCLSDKFGKTIGALRERP